VIAWQAGLSGKPDVGQAENNALFDQQPKILRPALIPIWWPQIRKRCDPCPDHTVFIFWNQSFAHGIDKRVCFSGTDTTLS